MHQDLERLQPYPFERLRALNTGVVPPQDRRTLALSIGEPVGLPDGEIERLEAKFADYGQSG